MVFPLSSATLSFETRGRVVSSPSSCTSTLWKGRVLIWNERLSCIPKLVFTTPEMTTRQLSFQRKYGDERRLTTALTPSCDLGQAKHLLRCCVLDGHLCKVTQNTSSSFALPFRNPATTPCNWLQLPKDDAQEQISSSRKPESFLRDYIIRHGRPSNICQSQKACICQSHF